MCLQFQFYLLETKEFNKLEYLSEKFINGFLEKKFGNSYEIKTLSKMLIENDFKKNAKYLNKLIKVLGSKNETRIIKTFFKQCPELEEIYYKEVVSFKKKRLSIINLDNYHSFFVFFLIVFLIIFILMLIKI